MLVPPYCSRDARPPFCDVAGFLRFNASTVEHGVSLERLGRSICGQLRRESGGRHYPEVGHVRRPQAGRDASGQRIGEQGPFQLFNLTAMFGRTPRLASAAVLILLLIIALSRRCTVTNGGVHWRLASGEYCNAIFVCPLLFRRTMTTRCPWYRNAGISDCARRRGGGWGTRSFHGQGKASRVHFVRFSWNRVRNLDSRVRNLDGRLYSCAACSIIRWSPLLHPLFVGAWWSLRVQSMDRVGVSPA